MNYLVKKYVECFNDMRINIVDIHNQLNSIDQTSFILEYLKQIKRTTQKYFLSINHECFHPRTVFNFIKSSSGYELVSRSKCWVREDYIEEVYRIK